MKSKTNLIVGLVSILFCLLTSKLNAQLSGLPCASDALSKSLYLSDPQCQSFLNATKQNIYQNLSAFRMQTGNNIKTIPVVVHVIHDNGPENISDAQVQDAIVQLNEDFRRISGTPGYGNGVDTEIQFELAKKDPNGNCTNGIPS